MSYEQKFLFSLLLTLVVEIPVAVFLVKFFYKHREIKISRIVLAGIVSSALTLPYFWFILPAYIPSRNLVIFLGEFLIVFIEAIIYKQFLGLKPSEAFIVSLLANMSSVFLGLVIF